VKTIGFVMANGLDLTTITSVAAVSTFIIGVLLGVIIKRAIKLALGIVALVVLLAVTGYLNLAGACLQQVQSITSSTVQSQ